MLLPTLTSAHPAPTPLPLPHPQTGGQAGISGFPSPAQDYEGETLDLNEHLIRRPSATFFLDVVGDSMRGVGIFDGDLLVVDRSVTARPGQIVVAVLDGEIVIKRYEKRGHRYFLTSAHPHYPAVSLEGTECQVRGVVTGIVRRLEA